MKILDHKDAMNRHLYQKLIIVGTAIHRISCLNRTYCPTTNQSSIPSPQSPVPNPQSPVPST
ncbi:MAG: hypothetical protein V7L27_32385 [Nostoc sp.]|uniref:hypothetical protein n=1 Tax=Nostoc sp. TaxID=1180 RepID=UPI002FFAEB9C